MASMLCMGSTSRRRAPRGGASIAARPMRAWFSPATLESLSSGTMSEVEACMAGHWKAPPVALMNIRA